MYGTTATLLREGGRKKWCMGSTGLGPSVLRKVGMWLFGNVPDGHTSRTSLIYKFCVRLRSAFSVKTSCNFSLSCGYLCSFCYFRQSRFMLVYWNLSLWNILCPCFWNMASRITASFRRLSAWVYAHPFILILYIYTPSLIYKTWHGKKAIQDRFSYKKWTLYTPFLLYAVLKDYSQIFWVLFHIGTLCANFITFS